MFTLSLIVKQFHLTHRENPVRGYYSRPEWTWEQSSCRVFHIPQRTSITEASPSDCLELYTHWILIGRSFTPLQGCSGIFCNPSSLGWIYISNVKLASVVEGDPKSHFLIATTLRCRVGHYSIPWIAPLYPWYVSYNAEC